MTSPLAFRFNGSPRSLAVCLRRCSVAAIAALAAGWFLSAAAQAAPVTLAEGNSSVSLDTQLQSGLSNWTIDGTNQLSQMWFWYRVGATGPETSIDALTPAPAGLLALDTNFEAGLDTMIAKYTDPQFELTLRVTLSPGSPGTGDSNLVEQVSIKNISGAPLPFNLFQFVHFNLNGVIDPDTVEILGSNTAIQTDSQLSLITTAETVALPTPSRRQVGTAASILAGLNDGVTTSLNNSVGPVTDPNVAFAFQWSHTIPTGGTLLVSSGQNVVVAVPEPSAVVLLSLGVVVAGGYGLRRRRALGR